MKRKELLFKLSPLIGKKIALYISYDSQTDPLYLILTVEDAIVLVNILPYRFDYRFTIV